MNNFQQYRSSSQNCSIRCSTQSFIMEQSGKVDVSINAIQTENIQIFVPRVPVPSSGGVELRTGSLGSFTTLLGLRPQRPCHHSAGVSPTPSRSPLRSKQHLLLLHFHMTSFPSELREPKGLLPPWLAALVRIHSRTYLKGGILLLCIHFICINVRCWNLVECFSLVRDSTPLSHSSVTD